MLKYISLFKDLYTHDNVNVVCWLSVYKHRPSRHLRMSPKSWTSFRWSLKRSRSEPTLTNKTWTETSKHSKITWVTNCELRFHHSYSSDISSTFYFNTQSRQKVSLKCYNRLPRSDFKASFEIIYNSRKKSRCLYIFLLLWHICTKCFALTSYRK